MKKAVLALMLLAMPANALFDSVVYAGFDFIWQMGTGNLSDTLVLVEESLSKTPDFGEHETFTKIHDSFTWLGAVFTLYLTLQGLKYTVFSENPAARAQVKESIQKLAFGMVLVSLNSTIYFWGLGIGENLTQMLNPGQMEGQEFAINAVESLNCLIMPAGNIIAFALMVVIVARYLLLLILYSLFPLILAMCISQIGFLTRLGQKGVNLYICCVLAGPAMALIAHYSLSQLKTGFTLDSEADGLQKMVEVTTGLGGLLLASLSPLIMFGLFDKRLNILGAAGAVGGAAVAGAATAGVGAAAGLQYGKMLGQAGTDQLGQAGTDQLTHLGVDTGLKDRIKSATQSREKKAYELMSSGNYTDDQLLSRLRSQGIGETDENGIWQPETGGAARYGSQEGYYELSVPTERGFGDRRSKEAAREDMALSSNIIRLKNAVRQDIEYGGDSYEVTVADQGQMDHYQVAVKLDEQVGYYQIPKDVDTSRRDVIDRIKATSLEDDVSPDYAANQLSR